MSFAGEIVDGQRWARQWQRGEAAGETDKTGKRDKNGTFVGVAGLGRTALD